MTVKDNIPTNDKNENEISVEYIAGFFDGEGAAGISKGSCKTRHTSKLGYSYNPEICILNTNRDIMQKIHLKLLELNIHNYVQTKKTNLPHHKTIWRIRIKGFVNMRRFCSIFKEKVFIKREQLILLEKYLTSRMNRPHQTSSYTQNEHEMVKALRKKNRGRGKSRQPNSP